MTVKVKPLVWVVDEDDPDCIRSGEYWIYHEGLGYQVYLGAVVFGDTHKTLAAAKDAVWQHHVAYVLAAIEAPDALALAAAAYRDAANIVTRAGHRLDAEILARTPADAQAALTAIERAAYERGVRDALTEAVKEAKGSVTIGGQRFLTAKLDDLEPAFLALLTQEGW